MALRQRRYAIETIVMTDVVSLLDADPELVSGIPDQDLLLARRLLMRPRYVIPAGRWAPELLQGHENGAFGVLVMQGVIIRQIDVADRHCTQLLGSGDVLQPGQAGSLLDFPVSWTALEPSAVVMLDERFAQAAQRWPSIALNLYRRLLEQHDRAAMLGAITRLPRVDSRIVAVFWHLAERWGRVTPTGIQVPLDLTHEALGRLVGAQRPTVSLALRELADAGALTRDDRGRWVLQPGSYEAPRPRVGMGHAVA
jgi:CRP/FNR family transcriptional regulator, cyclic AMP receptor protein